MKKTGQASVEFMLVIGIVLLIFVILLVYGLGEAKRGYGGENIYGCKKEGLSQYSDQYKYD